MRSSPDPADPNCSRLTLPMDSIKKAIENKDYEAAALQASEALATNPNSAPLLLARSTALDRLGKHEQALKDAEKAVQHAGTLQLRADAQLRRGVALYHLGKQGEARTVFGYASKTNQRAILAIWLQKITVPAEPVPEVPKSAEAQAPAEAASAVPAEQAPRFDWYQAGPKATICVYVRNAPKDAEIEFQSQQVSIKYPGLSFSIDLAHEIDPAASSYEIGTPKIELSLAKKQPGQWSSLAAAKPAPEAPQAQASFEKKWDIDDDEPGEQEDPNAFLQQIYDQADPDARRAMMKSFVESNGTSLSTNWSDVKKGKVETIPPSGMEAKTWK